MTETARRGVHHIGLATHDMEATLRFYEGVLGFPARVCELIEPEAGGVIRHAFLDVGEGELIAFMECNGVKGVQEDFDPGINRGLGIQGGLIHFAFKARDIEELERKRGELLEKTVSVSEIVDHRWCKSIYFKDPNGLQLEFCCLAEELGDVHVQTRGGEAWKRWARD